MQLSEMHGARRVKIARLTTCKNLGKRAINEEQ